MTKIPIGSHLFTFVVITDTHMNQKEDYSSANTASQTFP